MRNDDVFLQLYLIRHAESMGNAESKEEFDPVNPPLTNRGFEQAKLLAERFACVKLDFLYSSPLQRAKSVALEISKRNGLEIIFDDRLIECETAVVDSKFVGVRGDEDGSAERAESFINEIKEKLRGKRAAAVAHAEIMQFLIRAALGITDKEGLNFCAYNASVTKINFRDGKSAKLALQNDISHLLPLDGDRLEWM